MTALSVKNVKKTYSNGVQALKGISFSVEDGGFHALLGPNGAGKSTAIGILTSLVNKTAGSVSIYGHDIDRDFASAKACLGVVPQEFNFSIFETVHDILIQQAGYYGIPKKVAFERAEKYLRQLDLWEKRHTRSRNLSGGMKRRLMIARALIHEPRLLILDEPTAGVDIEIRRSMWRFLIDLNRSGTTIILTTHYLEEAEQMCRNITIINQGQVAEDTSTAELLQQLDQERFVLYLNKPLQTAPAIEGYTLCLQDENTLEVEVPKERSLTALFGALSQQGIDVLSMRNKANRLEELFVRLTMDKSA